MLSIPGAVFYVFQYHMCDDYSVLYTMNDWKKIISIIISGADF